MHRKLFTAAPGAKVLCCLFLFISANLLIADRTAGQRYLFTIRIGGLWDLSGDHYKEGQAAFTAARKAVEAINSQGGIGGRRLELVVADTRGKPGRLLLEAKTLIEREGAVVLLGPTSEELTQVLRGYAETYKVPVVLTSGDDPLLPINKEKSLYWSYSVSPGLRASIKALFQKFTSVGLYTIGPLVADTVKGKNASLWLRGYGPEYHLRVLPFQNFGIKDTDVINQLQQFKQEGAQVVVAWGPRSWGPALARSASGMDVHIAVPAQLLSSSMLWKHEGSFKLWTAGPPLLLGYDISPSHQCAFVVTRFYRAMGNYVDGDSVEEMLAAGAAWDALHLAAMGLKKADSATHLDLRNALENLGNRYYGVNGIFKPRKRDHSGLVPSSLVVLEWDGNGWKPVMSRNGR